MKMKALFSYSHIFINTLLRIQLVNQLEPFLRFKELQI